MSSFTGMLVDVESINSAASRACARVSATMKATGSPTWRTLRVGKDRTRRRRPFRDAIAVVDDRALDRVLHTVGERYPPRSAPAPRPARFRASVDIEPVVISPWAIGLRRTIAAQGCPLEHGIVDVSPVPGDEAACPPAGEPVG
jgi:hypothetical protein